MEMQIDTAAGKSDFDRIWALFEENSRQFNRQFKEVGKRFKETDAKFKETDAKFRETDRMLSEKIRETEAIVGRLGNRWGEFVEGLVLPSVIGMFAERNIEIERIFPRAKSRKGGETMEIDVIGANTSYATAVEVKSKLIAEDVKHFIEKLDRFKYFFPEYIDRKVVGAVAGIVIDESVVNFAEKKGLFVIAQKGEAVEIINAPNFKPNIW
jgi:hypothetical protein